MGTDEGTWPSARPQSHHGRTSLARRRRPVSGGAASNRIEGRIHAQEAPREHALPRSFLWASHSMTHPSAASTLRLRIQRPPITAEARLAALSNWLGWVKGARWPAPLGPAVGLVKGARWPAPLGPARGCRSRRRTEAVDGRPGSTASPWDPRDGSLRCPLDHPTSAAHPARGACTLCPC